MGDPLTNEEDEDLEEGVRMMTLQLFLQNWRRREKKLLRSRPGRWDDDVKNCANDVYDQEEDKIVK
jgi:hypothetical protein